MRKGKHTGAVCSRREFLAGAAAAWVGLRARSTVARAAERPNIVFLIPDDMDYYQVGAFGGEALTPNLDRVARQGVRFTNFHASTTVCTPSRYACLTGRYAGRSTHPHFLETFPPGTQSAPGFDCLLENDGANVASVLRRAGYATGHVGKWHLGAKLKSEEDFAAVGLRYIAPDADPMDPEVSAIARERQEFYGKEIRRHGFDYVAHTDWGNLKAPLGKHNPEWHLDAALRFMETNARRPFYLYLATTLLHGPDMSWERAFPYPRYTAGGILDRPPRVMPPRDGIAGRVRAAGFDEQPLGYTWLDDMVGALLKKLDDLGIAENTLFVFFPDHGSRFKASLYERHGTRVPVAMRWPRGIRAGTVCDALAQNVDFLPTFLDLAGVTPPEGRAMDGRSLRPLFDGAGGGGAPGLRRAPPRPSGQSSRDWREHLYFEIGCARAVRTRDWKYIAVRPPAEAGEGDAPVGKRRRGGRRKRQGANPGGYIGRNISKRGMQNPNFMTPDQLYAIRDDPDERDNLAGKPEHAAKLREMQAVLKTYLDGFPGRPFGELSRGGA